MEEKGLSRIERQLVHFVLRQSVKIVVFILALIVQGCADFDRPNGVLYEREGTSTSGSIFYLDAAGRFLRERHLDWGPVERIERKKWRVYVCYSPGGLGEARVLRHLGSEVFEIAGD